MNTIRSLIKTVAYIIAAFLYRGGAFFGHARPRVYILMYHSIESSKWKYGIAPHAFEQQLQYLKNHFTIVPLEQIVEYARGSCAVPDKTIAITFDDGYQGVYDHVLPLSRLHAVPFTVFLTTDLAESAVLGNMPRLTEDQVRDIAESGVGTIEAHGHTHDNLAKALADGFDVRGDLTVCIAHIERITKRRPRYFAYPSGHTSSGLIRLVGELFDGACGITEGRINPGDSLYTLKRVQVDRTMSFLQFRLRVSGGIDVHRAIIDYIRHFIP